MFKNSDIKKRIKDLDSATDSLQRFSRVVLINRPGITILDSSRKALQLSKALRRIHLLAIDLYTALCRCCGRGTCHSKHEANILLEDRYDVVDKILRPPRTTKMASMIAFQLSIEGNHLTSSQTWWHELPIQVLHKCEHDTTIPSPLSRVSFIGPIDTGGSNTTSIHTSFVPIDDFCAAITAAKVGAQPVSFVLSATSQIRTIITQEKTIIEQDNVQKITLKAIISGCQSLSYSTAFSLRLRMLLALRLASSLLQLSKTKWFDHTWSNEAIFFLLRPTNEVNLQSIDFSRAFVSAAIDDSDLNTTAVPSTQPKVALLELGILLLEIWHMTTLETYFNLETAPIAYYERLARALEWLEDSQNPPPDLYESAASSCIRGIPAIARQTGWDANEIWNCVCKDVVEPLSQNCKQWR